MLADAADRALMDALGAIAKGVPLSLTGAEAMLRAVASGAMTEAQCGGLAMAIASALADRYDAEREVAAWRDVAADAWCESKTPADMATMFKLREEERDELQVWLNEAWGRLAAFQPHGFGRELWLAAYLTAQTVRENRGHDTMIDFGRWYQRRHGFGFGRELWLACWMVAMTNVMYALTHPMDALDAVERGRG